MRGLILVALVAAFHLIAQPVRAWQDENCSTGVEYYFTDHYEQALDYLNKCIEDGNFEAYYYLARGVSHLHLNHTDAALADFQVYVETSTEPYRHYIVGDHLEDVDLYRYAFDYLDKAIELNPEHAAAYYERAEVHFQRDDWQAAIEDYDRVLALTEDEGVYYTYYNRSAALYNLKRFEESIEDVTVHIDQYPDDADGYQQRGDAYWEIRKFDEAVADYQHYETLNGSLVPYMQERLDERRNPLRRYTGVLFVAGFVLIAGLVFWRARREDRQPA